MNKNDTRDVIELKDEGVYEKISRKSVSSETYENFRTQAKENGDTSEKKVPTTKVVVIAHFVLVIVLVAAVIAVTAVVAIVIMESGNFGTNSKNSQQYYATNQSTEDLLTIIAEEKRLRQQLEDRLKYLVQSQNEERNSRQELEAKYLDMKAVLENMSSVVLDSAENNIRIANLSTALTAVEDQISVLVNHSAVIDQKIGNISLTGGQNLCVADDVEDPD